MNKVIRDKIGIFTLTMITAAFTMTVRNLPTLAQTGLNAIFFCLIVALGFAIPVALVSAELSTGWPEEGGVYVWVKKAFGEKWGFLAIWLQWIENVVWFPTALSFLGGALAYIFFPEIVDNKFYLIICILVLFWGTTLLNLLGMRISGLISTLGVIFGVFIPGISIILLAIIFLLQGNQIHLDLTSISHNWIPDMTKIENLTILVGFVFAFNGLEASAVHAHDVKKPKRNYPIAIFLMAAILFILNTLGSFSISLVIPQQEISLVSGVMEAFSIFLNNFHLNWLIKIFAFLVIIGSLGQLSTWIVGPTMGLLATSESGDLPPIFHKTTKHGMPFSILIGQGFIVTLLCLMFLFMPTINSSYWILLTLTSILYLIMYILMFAAAIYLRYAAPKVERTYKIPGGKFGMWIIAGIGFLFCLGTLFVAYFPPAQFSVGNIIFYESFLILGTILMIAVPLIIYYYRKPHWKIKKQDKILK